MVVFARPRHEPQTIRNDRLTPRCSLTAALLWVRFARLFVEAAAAERKRSADPKEGTVTQSKSATPMPRRGFTATILAAVTSLLARRADGQEAQSTPSLAPVRIGRRVVTGVDSRGRSRIDSEGPVPGNATWKTDRAQGLDFWLVRDVPTPLAGALEPTTDWEPGNRTPSGGVIGRLITWAPGFQYPVHTTPTLDFGVIVSGRLELILDTGSTILTPGDVVIQRGTAHGWRVVGDEPCTWAVILIDAQSRS